MTAVACWSPIISGDQRALSKLGVEALANQVYDMQLAGEPGQRLWAHAYRKGGPFHCKGATHSSASHLKDSPFKSASAER